MSNLNIENQHNEYNAEPVYYCKHCLSLRVRSIPRMEDSEYCDECGAMEVGKCSIEEWEALYESKFGHKYLDEF